MESDRPYQKTAVGHVYDARSQGAEATVLVSPTGSGKTHMAGRIAHDLVVRLRKRALVLAHRIELIDQMAEKMLRMDVPHSIYAAGRSHDRGAPCQIASIETLHSRDASLPAADLIIIDECHRVDARKIRARYPKDTWTIGLTATPCRLERRSLRSLHEDFDSMVVAASPRELETQGFIVPITIHAPLLPDLSECAPVDGDYDDERAGRVMSRPEIVGNVVDTWLGAGSAKTVVFACDIKHAEKLQEGFGAQGVEAHVVWGTMAMPERKRLLDGFAAGKYPVVINANLLVEGWDVPDIRRVVMTRPTKSITMYLQQIGRGVRPAPGKDRLELYDHVRNVWQHGDPYGKRDWNLDQTELREAVKQHRVETLWRCPHCFRVVLTSQSPDRCPYCSKTVERKGRRLMEKDGQIVEYDGDVLARIEAERKAREAGEARERTERGKRIKALFGAYYRQFGGGGGQAPARVWVFKKLGEFERSGLMWADFMRRL